MKFTSLLLSTSLLISQVACTSLQPSNEYNNKDNVVQVQKKENESSSKLKIGLIAIGIVAILALLANKVADDITDDITDGN